MAVITISRTCGSLGDELASYLASKLSCGLITREYALEHFFDNDASDIRSKLEESPKFFLKTIDDSGMTYRDRLIEELVDIAEESQNVVVLGMGGCAVFGSRQDAVNIKIIASQKIRTGRIARQYNVGEEEAENILTQADRKHKRFVSALFDRDLAEESLYDMVLNTDKVSVEECADSILALLSKKNQRLKVEAETVGNATINHQTDTPIFKNETEEEFARILDMYNIEWMYEPKTFPLEWDENGNITVAFSPDFYLPKFNLYLELTTMEQKYVTKKNKKARKVMELYPGTNVRIVYKKDFLELVERFKAFGG